MSRNWTIPSVLVAVPDPHSERQPSIVVIDHDIAARLLADFGVEAASEIRASFWCYAEILLTQIETQLAHADLRSVDHSIQALHGAASALGYLALAKAAETGRGILGLAPGLNINALRQTFGISYLAENADHINALAGIDPMHAYVAERDQDQYWNGIKLKIQGLIRASKQH